LTTHKNFLCRCEDLTVEECHKAIGDGYRCFEDLKRFLGVGTGPCQGKSCVQAAMRLVAEARGIPLDDVDVMTFRPPVRPVSFATMAAPDAPDAPDATPEASHRERGAPGRPGDPWAPPRTSTSDLPSPDRLPGGTVRPGGPT
jgi:bacterioferritin-associated ferredoxin